MFASEFLYFEKFPRLGKPQGVLLLLKILDIKSLRTKMLNVPLLMYARFTSMVSKATFCKQIINSPKIEHVLLSFSLSPNPPLAMGVFVLRNGHVLKTTDICCRIKAVDLYQLLMPWPREKSMMCQVSFNGAQHIKKKVKFGK